METLISILQFMFYMSILTIITEFIIAVSIVVYDLIEEKFNYKK